jgi:hypothetical protein
MAPCTCRSLLSLHVSLGACRVCGHMPPRPQPLPQAEDRAVVLPIRWQGGSLGGRQEGGGGVISPPADSRALLLVIGRAYGVGQLWDRDRGRRGQSTAIVQLAILPSLLGTDTGMCTSAHHPGGPKRQRWWRPSGDGAQQWPSCSPPRQPLLRAPWSTLCARPRCSRRRCRM